MSEDRSLDEFVRDGSAETERGDAADTRVDDDTEVTVVNSDTTVDAPAESTSSWTTGGDACDLCGDAVERRWRDGEAFVCADCKDW